jgi:protein-tyrosine phosphatase
MNECNLCMSIAPGRKKGRWNRDLMTDLQHIRHNLQVDVIVTLLENTDITDLKIESLFESITTLGMESVHHPIRDKWIPSSMVRFKDTVDEVVKKIREGKRVLVHCNGGKGRTATFVVCCLLTLGYSIDESIRMTRETRSGTLRNPFQIFYVHRYNSMLKRIKYSFY